MILNIIIILIFVIIFDYLIRKSIKKFKEVKKAREEYIKSLEEILNLIKENKK